MPDNQLHYTLEELTKWHSIINALVLQCYPILFENIIDGDMVSIRRLTEAPVNEKFSDAIRKLLHLNDTEQIFLV